MFISSTVLSFYYVKKPENIKYQINDCHGWMKRTIPWFHRLFRFYCNYTYCDEGVNFWHLKRFTVNVLYYGIADTSARSIDLLRDKCRNWIRKRYWNLFYWHCIQPLLNQLISITKMFGKFFLRPVRERKVSFSTIWKDDY